VREADLVSRVTGWFAESYGAAPGCVWHAPGRVNLIGEHTDYNDGLVLPFALRQGTLAAAGRRDDDVLELVSRQAPAERAVVRIGDLAPGAVTGWAAYPAGVAWALREAGHDVRGARIAIDSDLSRGAGLASSAALECAVLMALAQLAGLDLTRPQAAVLARRAENDFVGMPCGIMDQSASLRCAAGQALLLDCRSGAGSQVPLDPAAGGLTLILVDTRARHRHAGGEYADRRAACAAAARALGLGSLRELAGGEAALGGLRDPVLRRRARHVVTENERVAAAARLLRAGQLAGAGPLLSQSHDSLRDDFEVSWPEADAAVDAAVAAGALGARMTGGGFGGCVLALAPGPAAARVRVAVCAAFSARGWRRPRFLDAVPASGARPVG
jgi:galactokinase